MVPAEAFNIALDLSALGIIASWATIVICQIQLYRWSQKGILERPSFRLFGAPPYTSYATLLFLAAVVVLMCIENYWNAIALVIIVPALIGGWYAVRDRVLAVAQERVGITGNYPIYAETPLQDEFLAKDARRAKRPRRRRTTTRADGGGDRPRGLSAQAPQYTRTFGCRGADSTWPDR